MEWLFGKKMTPDEMLRKVELTGLCANDIENNVLLLFSITHPTESASSQQGYAGSGPRTDEDGAAGEEGDC